MDIDGAQQGEGGSGRRVGLLLAVVWYAATAWVAIGTLRRFLLPAVAGLGRRGWSDAGAWLDLGGAVLGLLLVIGVAVLVHVGVRAMLRSTAEGGEKGGPPPRLAFPSPPTLAVAGWLLAFSTGVTVALFLALRLGGEGRLTQALTTMLAAGAGSSIATILGYLKHASEEKDFDPAYSAWYVGRPLIGLLLGLLFYFVIEGGLVAVLPGEGGRRLNVYGLVAIGGLVGLFSKHAVEKLREVFSVVFRTQDQTREELLERLPEELRERVAPYLEGGPPAPGKGAGR